jgi:hypothetical protein
MAFITFVFNRVFAFTLSFASRDACAFAAAIIAPLFAFATAFLPLRLLPEQDCSETNNGMHG